MAVSNFMTRFFELYHNTAFVHNMYTDYNYQHFQKMKCLFHTVHNIKPCCYVVTVEMKRSIAIFPMYASEGKWSSQMVAQSVRRCFDAMIRRYPRSTKILEEITNDQAIDILLELRPGSEQGDGNGRSSPNIPVSTSGASAVVSSPVVTTIGQNAPITMAVTRTPQTAESR